MVLLKELNVTLGVGADRLGKTGGNSVKEIEVDRGVVLELAADDGVIGPLNFDEVGDTLSPIFFGDL